MSHEKSGSESRKLDIKAFALACSILWGAVVFLVACWIIILDGASGDLTWLGQIYLGFNISPVGSVIGLGWGFWMALLVAQYWHGCITGMQKAHHKADLSG